jgi:hypothetical protein
MTIKTVIKLLIILALTSGCSSDNSYLLNFARTLQTSKVCSESKCTELIKDVESGDIKYGIDFLKYCDYATIIDTKNYNSDAEKSLEKVHKDVAKIFPGLDFKDFKYQIVLDTLFLNDKETEFYNFDVQLNVDGKTYKHHFFYRLYNKTKKQYGGGEEFDPEFIDIFNKVLADKQSKYRLRVVDHSEHNAHDMTKFGVIAVTKEQSKAIHLHGYQVFKLRYGSFSNSISNGSILKIIEEYKKAGILNHLTKEQIDKSTEIALKEDVKIVNGILCYFPNAVHFFDMELANLENPYEEIIHKYRDISHGEFAPTEISDDFKIVPKGKVTLKFKLNGEQISKTFKVESDWINPEFFDFINSLATKNKLPGKFYWLYTGGQEALIIYLHPNQYEILKAKKALYFGNDHEENEDE